VLNHRYIDKLTAYKLKKHKNETEIPETPRKTPRKTPWKTQQRSWQGGPQSKALLQEQKQTKGKRRK